MCKQQNCFNCARREEFICFGIVTFVDTETKKNYGVNMQKHVGGTDVKIETEEDLKKIGHICSMFKPKAWSVS